MSGWKYNFMPLSLADSLGLFMMFSMQDRFENLICALSFHSGIRTIVPHRLAPAVLVKVLLLYSQLRDEHRRASVSAETNQRMRGEFKKEG